MSARKLMRIVKRPSLLVPWLGQRGFFHGMDDEKYLRICYRAYLGKELNLDNPTTYNEKIQWLKLYDRNPLYTTLVDKAEVKPWAAGRIGSVHIIPTLGVWDSFDDINFDILPGRFVLKTTHDSGGVVVCKDKSSFNAANARKKLARSLKRNFFYEKREWPYKNVPPRIIAEEYIEDASGELRDYKFFCFDGEPKFMFIASDRFGDDETKFDFFDMDFNPIPVKNGHPNSKDLPAKPELFGQMIDLARRLSRGLTHVRVDFYEAGNQIFFGEMTLYHWSGLVAFDPVEYDYRFGSLINIPYKVDEPQAFLS